MGLVPLGTLLGGCDLFHFELIQLARPVSGTDSRAIGKEVCCTAGPDSIGVNRDCGTGAGSGEFRIGSDSLGINSGNGGETTGGFAGAMDGSFMIGAESMMTGAW